MPPPGEVSERPKERDWKSRSRVLPGSRVQIPLSPLLEYGRGSAASVCPCSHAQPLAAQVRRPALKRQTIAISIAGASAIAAGALAVCAGGASGQTTNPVYQSLRRDVIVNADVWATKPGILAAGLGFVSIIGVPDADATDISVAQQAVQAVGGAFNVGLSCPSTPTPPQRALTSAVTPAQVANNGAPVYFGAGLPVEFSWPVRPSTVDPGDFRVTLNDQSVVTPLTASVNPNYEYNERSTVVLLGHFGNNLPQTDPAGRFATKIEVVSDSTPMQLIGPGGRLVSAVGMSATKTTSPYDDQPADPTQWTGPRLVGGKISRMSTAGEQAPAVLRSTLPNDGRALYGSRARFRVRVLTTGGFSPDGIRGLYPTDYRNFFQVIAVTRSGRRVVLVEPGRTYRIDGYPLRVVGLADLGVKQDSYDYCYAEDHDNQIDIILDGDIHAASRVRFVRIPAAGNGYHPFYNPGGPGSTPVAGVRYTAPGPRMTQRITNALSNPLTVTFRPKG